MVGVNHPSLWTFITRSKEEQVNHEQRLNEMWNGDPQPNTSIEMETSKRQIRTFTPAIE